jgi:CheY-like chemotaxis protein
MGIKGIKERRTLKIVAVDDTEDYLTTLGYLIKHSSEFASVPYEYESFHVTQNMVNAGAVGQELLKKEPDLLLLDCRLPSLGDFIPLAETVKSHSPDTTIMAVTSMPEGITEKKIEELLQQESPDNIKHVTQALLEERRKFKDLGEYKPHIIADFADKLDPDLLSKTRRLAYKPIDSIGIRGFGAFGQELALLLCRSRHVKNVKVYSPHVDVKYIIRGMEQDESTKKIQECKNLEALAEGVDFLVWCESAIPGQSVKIADGHYDRLVLFPYEYKKIEEDLETLRRVGFDGFFDIVTNPIGPISELIRRKGFNQYRITSNFKNDSERMQTSIRHFFDPDDELYRLADNDPWGNKLIVGIHGVPHFAVPSDVILSDDQKGRLDVAEQLARELPYLSQEALKKLGMRYQKPQFASLSLFLDFVHYRNPYWNAYCYTVVPHGKENLAGFVALPSYFNYREMKLYPDDRTIESIGRKTIHSLITPDLIKARTIVAETLGD